MIVTKILLFILCFASAYLFYEVFDLGRYLFFGSKYEMTNKRLVYIGLAIAYILTIIITGFAI
jgi:hypothetical protein